MITICGCLGSKSGQGSVHPHTRLQVGILILGSGPTGLGAATRLQQHGYANWLMVDSVRPYSTVSCNSFSSRPVGRHTTGTCTLCILCSD